MQAWQRTGKAQDTAHYTVWIRQLRHSTRPIHSSSKPVRCFLHLVYIYVDLTRFLDDDDDFDEDNIPGFSHPMLAHSPKTPDKGKTKAREPEQLAPPGGTTLSGTPELSGNIGSSANGTRSGSRQTVGGLRVETRFVAS